MGVLDDVWDRMLHNGDRALQQIAGHLAGEASRGAPLREGTLRGSPFPDDGQFDVNVRGDSHVVTVVFPLVYAKPQELREDYEHPRGGHAHYLGRPLKANNQRYLRTLNKAINHPERLP